MLIVMDMALHPMSTQLNEMAWQIDRSGIDSITPQQLRQIRHAVGETGVRTALVEVLADQTAPAPARNRAFGRIAMLISRHLHQATATTGDNVACAACAA